MERYLKAYARFNTFHQVKEEDRKIAGLLHLAGSTIVDIYSTLETNPKKAHATEKEADNVTAKMVDGDADTFQQVCDKLTNHFNPKRSRMYEVHMFRLLRQNPEESVLSFVTRLRTAAKYCEFHSVDFEIASSVLSNGSSDWLTKKALAGEKGPTLESIMKLASSNELSTNQSKAMRESDGAVNQIGDKYESSKSNWQPRQVNRNDSSTRLRNDNQSPEPRRSTRDCRNCGEDSEHRRCPATDSTCKACGRTGHWSEVCRSKHRPLPDSRHSKTSLKSNLKKNRVNYVDNNSDSFDENHVFGISQDPKHSK